jgi:hypothetical protein
VGGDVTEKVKIEEKNPNVERKNIKCVLKQKQGTVIDFLRKIIRAEPT